MEILCWRQGLSGGAAFSSALQRGDKTYPLPPPTQSMFCPEALHNKYTSRHSLNPSSKKVQYALKSQGWTYRCQGEQNLCLSFLWYQQCPLSMKVRIQDTEALFEWRGTSQPRSDGTVEKPNRTEYLWSLWPNRSRTFTLVCKGLQLSYHLRLSGDSDISFLLANTELGYIYWERKLTLKYVAVAFRRVYCFAYWL